MLWLYNLLISLLWPLMYLYPPFRGTISQRLGYFNLQQYDPGSAQPKFLFNAVSAGEVVAVSSVIKELRNKMPDAQISLLTTTASGREMAKKQLEGVVDLVTYFPLVDLPFVVRRYLGRLKPDIYVTTESELWPNIQNACRNRGIRVILVNARIYLHNKTGIRKLLVRKLYDMVDLVVCQDDEQKSRFAKFGIPESALAVSGNVKFDLAIEPWDERRVNDRKDALGLSGSPLLVAGSTHPGEEELILNAFLAARQDKGPLALVLAPRHIERCHETASLAESKGLSSQLHSLPRAEGADVTVVDSYGILVDMYQLADVVIMGGTFSPKVGGHNILEATALGKPVVVGSHTFSIEQQIEMLEKVNGIAICPDPTELSGILRNLLEDNKNARALGGNALEATMNSRGAAARAAGFIIKALNTGR